MVKVVANALKQDRNNFRYERKFNITELPCRKIILLVKQHPEMFREIYNERTINNIYLDTHNKKSYYENEAGIAGRTKYRIRWYGKSQNKVKNPKLELKIKKGLVGSKVSYDIPSFELDKYFNYFNYLKIIRDKNLPNLIKEELKSLKPSLLNNYCRRYFLSNNKNFRITIDYNQNYSMIKIKDNLFLNKIADDNSVILEIKYNLDRDKDIERITNYFPFRMTKNSKYMNGVDKLSYS